MPALREISPEPAEERWVVASEVSATVTVRAPVLIAVAAPCMYVNSLKGCRLNPGSMGTNADSTGINPADTSALGAQIFQYR